MKKIYIICLTIFISHILSAIAHTNNSSKKLVRVNDLQPVILFPDTIKQLSVFRAKIYLNNKKYKLKQVYCTCSITTPTDVDTMLNIIPACEARKFRVYQDTATAYIHTGTGTGKKETNYEITLLAVDKDNNFYYDNMVVVYSVTK